MGTSAFDQAWDAAPEQQQPPDAPEAQSFDALWDAPTPPARPAPRTIKPTSLARAERVFGTPIPAAPRDATAVGAPPSAPMAPPAVGTPQPVATTSVKERAKQLAKDVLNPMTFVRGASEVGTAVTQPARDFAEGMGEIAGDDQANPLARVGAAVAAFPAAVVADPGEYVVKWPARVAGNIVKAAGQAQAEQALAMSGDLEALQAAREHPIVSPRESAAALAQAAAVLAGPAAGRALGRAIAPAVPLGEAITAPQVAQGIAAKAAEHAVPAAGIGAGATIENPEADAGDYAVNTLAAGLLGALPSVARGRGMVERTAPIDPPEPLMDPARQVGDGGPRRPGGSSGKPTATTRMAEPPAEPLEPDFVVTDNPPAAPVEVPVEAPPIAAKGASKGKAGPVVMPVEPRVSVEQARAEAARVRAEAEARAEQVRQESRAATVDPIPEAVAAKGVTQAEWDGLSKSEKTRYRTAVGLEQAEPFPALKYDTERVKAARAQSAATPPTSTIQTPERQQLRQQLTDKHYGQGSKTKGKTFTVVVGLPGSGKSSVIADDLKAEERGVLVPNVDAIAKELPEYGQGEGKQVVHAEAAQIRADVLARAIEHGDDIVYETLAGKPEEVRGLAAELAKRGWQTRLVVTRLPGEKAAQRAVDRFEQGGHFVDPEHILKVGADLDRRLADLTSDPEAFHAITEYDTDVQPGERFRVIRHEEGGAPVARGSDAVHARRRGGRAAPDLAPDDGSGRGAPDAARAGGAGPGGGAGGPGVGGVEPQPVAPALAAVPPAAAPARPAPAAPTLRPTRPIPEIEAEIAQLTAALAVDKAASGGGAKRQQRRRELLEAKAELKRAKEAARAAKRGGQREATASVAPGMALEDGVPRFTEARAPSGSRRQVHKVTTDGLIAEYDRLLQALSDARARAEYVRTFDDDVSEMRTVASRPGGGVSSQAKALRTIADLERIMGEIDAELAHRGVSDEEFADRITKHHETRKAAEEAAKLPKEEDYVRDEHGNILFEKGPKYAAGDDPRANPAFARWFGDSKVVDAAGKPLVVFHGTRADFDTFREGSASGWGDGIYFTDNAKQAAEEFGHGGRVVPVYLSIQHPYRDGPLPKGLENTAAWKAIADRWDDVADAWQEDSGFVGAALRELGYDGIIARGSNNIDGLEIVAFRPEQIKSATGNAGTFDPQNPSILAERGPGYDAAQAGLFGDEPAPAARQESLFGGKEGTEAARSLTGAERAAKGELQRIDQALAAKPSPLERTKLLRRKAELERLVNRGTKISGEEMAARAEGEREVPPPATERGQQALFERPRKPWREALADSMAKADAPDVQLPSMPGVSVRMLSDAHLAKARAGAQALVAGGDTFGPWADDLRVLTAEIARREDEVAQRRGDMRVQEPVRAYHGTPHKFDRFSLAKIGTGEGHQSFGWGLYFTGTKEVAQHYRDRLSAEVPTSVRHDILMLDALGFNTWQEALKAIQDHPDWRTRWDVGHDAQEREAIDRIESFVRSPRGSLFEVELPDDENMLMWDAKLTDQPPQVQAALESVGLLHRNDVTLDGIDLPDYLRTVGLSHNHWNTSFHYEVSRALEKGYKGPQALDWALDRLRKYTGYRPEQLAERDALVRRLDALQPRVAQRQVPQDWTGEDLYRDLQRKHLGAAQGQLSDEGASRYLASIGIPGLRYLDGLSRRKGEGSYNYVVFDDDKIAVRNISEKKATYDATPAGVGGFHSRLERAIDAAPFPKGTAEQWSAALSKNVAKGEREWTGIDRFLAENAGKVLTRDEVKDAFEQNRIRLGETVLSREGAVNRAHNIELTRDLADYAERDAVDQMFRDGIPIQRAETIARYARFEQRSWSAAEDLAEMAFGRDDAPVFSDAARRALDEVRRAGDDARLAQLRYGSFERERNDAKAALESRYEGGLRMLDGDWVNFTDMLDRARRVSGVQGAVNRGMEWIQAHRVPHGPGIEDKLRRFITADIALEKAMEAARRQEPKHESLAEPGGTNYRELVIHADGIEEWSGEDDTHFGDVSGRRGLAWARLTDRTLPTGEKVLFAEEIQSKRHQQGRTKGYKHADSRRAVDEQMAVASRGIMAAERALEATVGEGNLGGGHFNGTEYGGIVYWDRSREVDGDYARIGGVRPKDAWGTLIDRTFEAVPLPDATPSQRAALEQIAQAKTAYEAARVARVSLESGVPDAPMKKTEEWAGLVLRRLLDEAVRGGYDYLAWTTGDQQAARYDLSKQVKQITYWPSRDELVAFGHGGEVVHQGNYDPKALPDVIGKEAAERLLAAPPAPSGMQMIEGDDLKVGGDGMRAFYDRMLGNFAKDLGKKLGVKIAVEEVPVFGGNHGVVAALERAAKNADDPDEDIGVILRDVADRVSRGRSLTDAVVAATEGMSRSEVQAVQLMVEQATRDALTDEGEVPEDGPALGRALLAEADHAQQDHVDDALRVTMRRMNDGESLARAVAQATEGLSAAESRDVNAAVTAAQHRAAQDIANSRNNGGNPAIRITPELARAFEEKGRFVMERGRQYRDPDQADLFVQRPADAKTVTGTGKPEALSAFTPEQLEAAKRAMERLRRAGLPLADERAKQVAAGRARSLQIDFRGRKIRSPKEAATVMRALRHPAFEYLTVFYLDDQGKILGHETTSSGVLQFSVVPDDWHFHIAERAKLLGSPSVVFGHNHPSGDPAPSDDDVDVTREQSAQLSKLGIRVVGHVIINHEQAAWINGKDLDRYTFKITPDDSAPWVTAVQANTAKIFTPQMFAGALAGALDPSALTVVYTDSQGRIVAVEAHPGPAADTIADWLPRQKEALAARQVFIAGPTMEALDLANAAGLAGDQTLIHRPDLRMVPPDHWAADLVDIFALGGAPFTPTSLRETGTYAGPPRADYRHVDLSPKRIATYERPTPDLPDRGGRGRPESDARAGRAIAGGGGAGGGGPRGRGPDSGREGPGRDLARVPARDRVSEPPSPYTPDHVDRVFAYDDIDFSGEAAKEAGVRKGTWLDKLNRFADAVANGYGEIERLGERVEGAVRPTRNPRDLLTVVKNSDYTVKRFMTEGVVDPTTGEIVGPSFTDLFARFDGNITRIQHALKYVKAERDVGRGLEGMAGDEAAFRRAEERVAIGRADPELRAFARDWQAFVEGVGQYAVKSGLWTEALWRKLRDSDALYVRYKRIVSPDVRVAAGEQQNKNPGAANKRVVNVGPGVQRFKGSTLAVTNPAEAMAEYVGNIIRRADRYRVGAALFDATDALGSEGVWLLTRIKNTDPRVRGLVTAAARQKAKDLFLDEQALDELVQTFDIRLDPNNPVIWRNTVEGRKEYAQVNSPELWQAVAALHATDDSALRTVLNYTVRPLKRIFTAATTGLAPRFVFGTNPVRDVPVAIAQSRAGMRPRDLVRGYLSAFAAELGQNHRLNAVLARVTPGPVRRTIGGAVARVEEAKAAGLGNVSMYRNETDPKAIQRRVAPTSLRDKIRVALTERQPLAKGLHALERFGDASDKGPRVAEYLASLRRNAPRVASGEWTLADLRLRAATEARPVSIDFSNKPGNAVVRFFADYIPFFGPATQAPIVLTRATARNPRRVAGVVAFIAMATLLAWAMKHRLKKNRGTGLADDAVVNDRPIEERATYLMVPVDDRGTVLRVPIGQEFGVLSAGITALLDAWVDDDPHAGDLFAASVVRMLPPGVKETLEGVAPLPGLQQVAENARNRRVFGNRPVEPRSMQSLPVAERRYEGTSPTFDLAAALARKAGFSDVSPLKAENLIRGVTSSATPLVTTALDPLASKLTGRPTPRGAGVPLSETAINPASVFVRNRPPASSQSEEDYFTVRAQVDQAHTFGQRALKAEDPGAARRALAEYGPLLTPQVQEIVAATDRELDAIKDDETLIRGGRDRGELDAARARELLDRLRAKRQRTTRTATRLLRQLGVSP